MKETLTRAELAKVLGISERTIARWIKQGKIPCYKCGNLQRFDLDEVMEAMKREAK